jgi:hypothetical protein
LPRWRHMHNAHNRCVTPALLQASTQEYQLRA